MHRLKTIQSPALLPPQFGAEPPTEPGIWTKLLPDGRRVPWIVLPPADPHEAESPTAEASSRSSRGCNKCTF